MRGSHTLFARLIRAGLLVLFGLLLAACEGTVDVVIDVEEDGSGAVFVEVGLDEEAASQLLDLESGAGLPLIDLNEAGWIINPPAIGDDGRTTIGASKEFGTAEQLRSILDELSGSDDLFRDIDLVRTKSFARVDYQLTGELVPQGFESFGDQALTDALGRSVESFVTDGGGTLSDIEVSLEVVLPGTEDEDVALTGTPVEVDDDGVVRRWSISLDDSAATPIATASSTRNVAPLVWRGVAVVAGVLAGLILLGHLLRLLRPTGRRRKKKNNEVARARPSAKGPSKDADSAKQLVAEAVEDDAVSGAEEEGSDHPAVVALDGMGVLYREGQDISEILLPFVREMGSEVTSDEVVSRARALSLGRLTPADFWRMIGVDGDPDELDEAYLSRIQLAPGVVAFLRDLRERGVQVACITNDNTVWANKLRARHSLDGLIDPWVISGAVGVRKPDWPIFEVLRRVTRQSPTTILVVDDNLDNLDAAREFGYQTAWFAPDGDPAGSRNHAILRSFNVADPAPETVSSE